MQKADLLPSVIIYSAAVSACAERAVAASLGHLAGRQKGDRLSNVIVYSAADGVYEDWAVSRGIRPSGSNAEGGLAAKRHRLPS
jgi:hypothetical protein